MNDPVATPIQVNASSTPATVEALAGQLIPLVAGALVVYCHLSNNDAAAIAPGLIAGAGALWRVLKTRSTHAKLVVTAKAAPNEVAQVK